MTTYDTKSASPLLDILFDEDSVGRCLVAPDGSVLRANREWLRSTGFSLGEVLGANIVDLFPETRDMSLALHARARAGHRVEVPRHAQQIGVRDTWWEGRIEPVPMDGGTGLLITAREVGRVLAAAAETGRRYAPDGTGPRAVPAEGGRPREAEQLTKLAESVPGVICSYRLRPDGVATMPFSTRTVGDLYGFPPEVLARDMGPVLALIHRDDLQRVNEGIAETARTLARWHDEFRYLHPTKGLRWIEGWAAPVTEPDGSVLWHGYLLDVTERKRVEEALRDSEQKFATIFQRSPLANAFARVPEGTLAGVNDAWVRLTGVPREEALGRTSAELGLVADGARGQLLQDVLARGTAEAEVSFATRTNGIRVVVTHVELVSLAGQQYVLGAMHDVTEQRRAEKELGESEARFRALADSMPALAWTARPDGYITWYNRRWYDYTGTTAAQVEGWGWQTVHDPAVLPEVTRRWRESISTGAEFEMEFPLRGADGVFRHFLSRVFPLKDREGNVLQWFGTNTDVTTLVEAKEVLREANRRKTEFLGVLSHELRNPLAPIRTSVYVLERAAPGSEAFSRARQVIQRQVEHLARLVDGLLDVIRIERGKVALQRTRMDLRELVHQAVDDARTSFAQAGVELRLEPAPGPTWLDADPTRILQVVGNLLQNAEKFTPAGGLVTVNLRSENGTVRLTVKDTGSGMESGHEQEMFEPFAQGEQGLARTKGGLGLGLSLVRAFVELHGGTVSARSEGMGRGTEFVVTLPLAATPSADPKPGEHGKDASRRILVIEDNLDAAQTLADLLALEGHAVEIATGGRDGVAKARVLQPDVVLCDIGLPDVDGYEVARMVRASPGLERTRLIALTGYAQPEDRERAVLAGFEGLVAKPTNPEILARVLREGA